MSSKRRYERLCGILAGALGLPALAIVLVAPLVPQGFEHCSSAPPNSPPIPVGCVAFIQHVSIAEHEGLAAILPFLIFFALLCVGIITGAIRGTHCSPRAGRTLLWTCTALLVVTLSVELDTIGVFFLPGALRALVASALALIQRGDTTASADTSLRNGTTSAT